MGAKKFHNLFKKSGASKSAEAPLKSAEQDMHTNTVKDSDTKKISNTQDKVVVENLKNVINAKLKDPAMAKKAAQIIQDLLNKK